ncbi:MAG TPA: alpha/beta fold hydrolase [Burkholderiales bacterium]
MHRLVETADGQRIAARFFAPEGNSKGAVLIAPAMGVSQDYYQPFASWLAAQGFTVATFDYRGTGLSRSGALRGFRADIFDWARLDCAAMIDALQERPLYWIGHSLGGQILPLVPNQKLISKVLTIATGSGYWRENSPQIRPMAWWLWFVVVPPVLALWGYFPGKSLRKVGDLPEGVMRQWRRWCLDPEYAVGAEGPAVRAAYAAVRAPIVSISFADDEMMSARNTESMHGFYSGAPRTMKRIAPRDIGVKRIGHFGFFRAAFEPTLWRAHLLPELA